MKSTIRLSHKRYGKTEEMKSISGKKLMSKLVKFVMKKPENLKQLQLAAADEILYGISHLLVNNKTLKIKRINPLEFTVISPIGSAPTRTGKGETKGVA